MSNQLLSDQPILHSGIRCVAFDAVGTVIYPEPSVASAYASIAKRHGSRLTESDVEERLPLAVSVFDDHSSVNDFRTSEDEEHELWKQVVARVFADVDPIDDCFNELYDWFGRVESWRIFPNTGPTFAAIRQRGIKLVLASNFDQRLHAVCDGFRELSDVQIRVVSSEVGFRKPSLQYYRELAKACECAPDKILMVGDTPRNDVDGAIAAGLSATLIDRREDAAPTHRISSLLQLVPLERIDAA